MYKSRFRGLEVLLPLVLLRPVRCGNCRRRYYRSCLWRWLKPSERYADKRTTDAA